MSMLDLIDKPGNDCMAHFRAPGAMREKIDSLAAADGLTFSAFIRRCLAVEIDKRDRAAARAARAERKARQS